MARRSLLSSTLNTSSADGETRNGRRTDFIAMTAHAELVAPHRVTFTEHANRDGCRMFELNTQVPGPVRHVAREIAEADYDYCIAFYNRRTRETTFRPVSLLRVQAQISRPGEKLDSLEERRRSQSVNYSLDKSLTLEESREQQRILTDQFGNARKRKALEEQQRRKIDDKLMEAMTSATFDATLDSSAASTSDAKPATFSMLTAPESDIIPKLDKTAKTPDAIFKMEDFFASPEQRDVYKKRAAEWFKENNTAEALNKIGVPKFIASVIFVGYKKSELHAAVALKASILANVLKVCWPKSSLRTFLCFFYVCLANGTKQCAAGDFIVAPIECVVDVANAFLLGAKPGFYKMQSQHRDRLFLHMIAMYFVLSAPRYIFPFGPALSELASASARVGLSEQTMKKLCMGIGCITQKATADQIRTLNTANIAQLVGFIDKPTRIRKLRR